MQLCKGTVISNTHVTEDYYHLKIKCFQIAQKVKEGQIIHIRCGEHTEPLLRRPFSIYRFHRENGEIEFMYIVKGKGTEILKELKKGDSIDLLGPGGNHYEIDEKVKAIGVIGRGVGIASIVSLAEKARNQGIDVVAILSGRTKEAIISQEFLKDIGCKVFVLNDQDGSSTMTNVEKILTENILSNEVGQIFTCGSNRIARLVRDIGKKYNVSAYVSLEEHMACGIGVCHGCTCHTKDGYKTVCKDGPIFDVREVIL